MRLLLISADYPPIRSGESSHAYYLSVNLARKGNEVTVLTSAIEGVARPAEIDVQAIMKGWKWKELPRLALAIRQIKPDGVLLIFFSTMYEAHPMMTFAANIAKAVVPRVSFVTQIEHICEHWKGSWTTRIVRKGIQKWVGGQGVDYQYGTLLRDSDRIIILSEAHRPLLRVAKGFSDAKTTLVPPPPIMAMAPDADGTGRIRVRDQLSIAQTDIVLLYYGLIYQGKGLETLLEAVSKVAQARPNLRLVVVGGYIQRLFHSQENCDSRSYEQEMVALTRRLGIEKAVIWSGFCDPQKEQASLLFRGADICVLPFDDGLHLNNSSYAAAACHCLPIISTIDRRPPPYGTEQEFVHKKNVYLCEARNALSLAEAIHTLIEQENLRETLRQGASVMAETRFSWEKATELTLAALAQE